MTDQRKDHQTGTGTAPPTHPNVPPVDGDKDGKVDDGTVGERKAPPNDANL